MKKLALLEFISSHSDWEKRLSTGQYNIKIKRNGDFIIFNYGIAPNFADPVVKECRGIILHEPTMTPVCVPFFKFGNYNEAYADQIDWKTARVQEKIDGSLIKLWFFKGDWYLSTNGSINAFDAALPSGDGNSFGDLFTNAAEGVLDPSSLNTEYTYMFEVVSPYNKVVVSYPIPKIYHIGSRHNATLEEADLDIGVQKPRSYSLNTLEDVVAAAQVLPVDEEGYVVVDGDWRRVKIKSPAYIAAHHSVNNHQVTNKRILEMILEEKADDFLSVFPEYSGWFEEIENQLTVFTNRLDAEIAHFEAAPRLERKEFAALVKDSSCPAALFAWYSGKINSASEWLVGKEANTILGWIKEIK